MTPREDLDGYESNASRAPRVRSEPEVEIVACPDGPFLVRGTVQIVTPEGEPLPRRRRTVALCRCGKSMLKPYCDGTHKIIGFRTEPEEPAGPERPD
ncbi:CDGSH iron-sulfur domain-containing protein [Curtobacterium ammoniigenes]|uniref:CDGSH iron-sulfur domain-containing protein n=1 Tax=Curtobacterium ammoniigenes TaxID=395387 RepID=UPI0009F9C4AF|nr:CDGSH iron-sulfur domain-containing protein [Curtobacterium ammoniigenes]